MRDFISILFISCFLIGVNISTILAQSPDNPDSLAVKNGIILQRELSEMTLYDYGQTKMKMKFIKTETSIGNLYESIISLATPVNLYKDPKTTIRLSLQQTRSFIRKLYVMLQIDKIKDTETRRRIVISGTKAIPANTSIWRQDKEYNFLISNEEGGEIYFELQSNQTGNIDESIVKGYLLSGGKSNYFTVNNYKDFLQRIGKAVGNFQRVVESAQKDKKLIRDKNIEQLVGEVINYKPIIDSGYQVLRSNVHDTESIKLVADINLKLQPRKVPFSEYKDQFDNYRILRDEQLNLYVEEKINYEMFVERLLKLLSKKSATGILDPRIVHEGNIIKGTFSIFK